MTAPSNRFIRPTRPLEFDPPRRRDVDAPEPRPATRPALPKPAAPLTAEERELGRARVREARALLKHLADRETP